MTFFSCQLFEIYCVFYTYRAFHFMLVKFQVLFVVQSLSHVLLFATPWTAACQASLSFTISQRLLKLMSIELVMPSDSMNMSSSAYMCLLYWTVQV